MTDELHYNGYRIPTNRVSWSLYSGGRFFITVCTKDGVHYFGNISDDKMNLSELGNVMQGTIERVTNTFPYATVPYSIVMPNHIHLYIVINIEYKDLPPNVERFPLISRIVNMLKGTVTRYAKSNDIPFKWQSRFYDHIVRNDKDADNIINYIMTNPQHWIDDKYHR